MKNKIVLIILIVMGLSLLALITYLYINWTVEVYYHAIIKLVADVLREVKERIERGTKER